MAEKVIFALILVTLVVLYMGMRSFLQTPDPLGPATVASVHAVLEKEGKKCDSVDSLLGLGTDNGWTYTLARCHDGGRYVFSQNPTEGHYGTMTCAEEQANGYFCPE